MKTTLGRWLLAAVLTSGFMGTQALAQTQDDWETPLAAMDPRPLYGAHRSSEVSP